MRITKPGVVNSDTPSDLAGNQFEDGHEEVVLTLDRSAAWPDPLEEAAYHGVAGEIVRAIEPHTESDSVALLIQLLTAVGNVIGRHTYFEADGAQHYPILFVVLVGTTSKGRKGTSWGQILRLLKSATPTWGENCIAEGLSSGEGLIWAVRDPILKHEPIKRQFGIRGQIHISVENILPYP